MKNPWKNLKKPLWILAPMEDVTDSAFRQLLCKIGKPDIFFTEFTSTDGLTHDIGKEKVSHRLEYTKSEKPIIAQIWGKNPQHYYEIARQIYELGFDGVDINMGCPVKKIINQGCCSALIKNPELASEIIQAVQEAVEGQLPVSVKTRIGFDTIITETWCQHLLKHNLDTLIIHGRTTKELSKVPCHWEEISKVPKLRDQISPKTVIIGNGDIMSREQGNQCMRESGIDGIMIGRGIFHNPWFFNRDYSNSATKELFYNGKIVTKKQKLRVCQEHIIIWNKTWNNRKPYNALKKYFKIYIQGFSGASALRNELMQTNNYQEGLKLLNNNL